MKYYVTTPIYYINDRPHIGHAYSTIIADTLARYHRLNGDEVFFLTGTDENSQKNIEAAERAGMGDSLQEYLDSQSAIWRQTWDSLGMTHTDFIRTTEERHKKGVAEFFRRVSERGDIYKGEYVGYYCTGCEAFVRDTDLVDGLCPYHKTPPKEIREENYFFALSKYRDQLLSYIEENPSFIQPQSRKNEIVNYIRDHLEDMSISRQSMTWGIPVPGDSSQVLYVWFDALINYLTGIGFGWDEHKFAQFWPADVHIVGKDIIKFHCALWPAMLLSAGLPLPQHIFAHGFFTINGEKIGKSMGNTIDPIELSRTYGLDALRYFFLREIPFGGDGDFSFDRIAQRYQSDLSRGIGNFASRVLALAEKCGELPDARSHSISSIIEPEVEKAWKAWARGFEEYEIDASLDAIHLLIGFGDKLMEQTKPWSVAKEHPEEYPQLMAALTELVRHVSVLIYPILPDTAAALWDRLGIAESARSMTRAQLQSWGTLPLSHVRKGDALFPPIIQ